MTVFDQKKLMKMLAIGIVCLAAGSLLEASDKDQKYNYTPHGRRDPFIPLVSPSGYLLEVERDEDSALSLEGIMYDPKGDSMAIINGELVRVGEAVGGAVLTRIEPTRVVVIKDNQTLEIELRREE